MRPFASDVLEGFRHPGSAAEFGDDLKSQRVAPNTGEVIAEQVSRSMEVASGSGADHFDVVAFPVHLVATDGARGRLCDGVEIGDGEPKGRIGVDRAT
jgi:hypothetical protein